MVYCFSTDNESRIQAEVSCNKAVMTSNKTIRESLKKKKLHIFGTVPKRGGRVLPKPKL